MSVLEPKMLDDNCLMSLRQKDKEGMIMRQDKADAEPIRGEKGSIVWIKKGKIGTGERERMRYVPAQLTLFDG